MSGPIKPKDVQKNKDILLPEGVFQAFNELIVEKWDGSSATFTQEEAGKRVASVLSLPIGEIYLRRYLDVESAYRKAGWKVEFDHAGYNEFYDSFFKFSKKKASRT